jgi:hypothetical protein
MGWYLREQLALSPFPYIEILYLKNKRTPGGNCPTVTAIIFYLIVAIKPFSIPTVIIGSFAVDFSIELVYIPQAIVHVFGSRPVIKLSIF